MTDVVGYIRVSSENQVREGHGLDVQKEGIEKYCITNNLNLLYVFEDVQSGESAEKRKGLQAALKMLESDNVMALVVHKQDRFTRSVYDAEVIRKQLKERGKILLTVTDSIDWSTDNGEMLYQFMSVFAEYERKQIRKRCVAGYLRKVENGGYAAGHPPFGYDAVKGELVVNELEIRAMGVIKEMRDSGLYFRVIADYLNACEVKTKRGCRWTGHSVRALYNRRPSIKLKLPPLPAAGNEERSA